MQTETTTFEDRREQMLRFLMEATQSEFVREGTIVVNNDKSFVVSLTFDDVKAAAVFDAVGGFEGMPAATNRQVLSRGKTLAILAITR